METALEKYSVTHRLPCSRACLWRGRRAFCSGYTSRRPGGILRAALDRIRSRLGFFFFFFFKASCIRVRGRGDVAATAGCFFRFFFFRGRGRVTVYFLPWEGGGEKVNGAAVREEKRRDS